MIFTIIDSLDNELTGAKAHAVASIKAGLTVQELVESFAIASLVRGINVMCNGGAEIIAEAERYPESGAE